MDNLYHLTPVSSKQKKSIDGHITLAAFSNESAKKILDEIISKSSQTLQRHPQENIVFLNGISGSPGNIHIRLQDVINYYAHRVQAIYTQLVHEGIDQDVFERRGFCKVLDIQQTRSGLYLLNFSTRVQAIDTHPQFQKF